jgi:dynactin complex subunit
MSDFYIGKRLSFDDQLCTVRYYGKVKGTKGDWLGVEWDDPVRGKHNGENGGIKYFESNPTRNQPPPRFKHILSRFRPQQTTNFMLFR